MLIFTPKNPRAPRHKAADTRESSLQRRRIRRTLSPALRALCKTVSAPYRPTGSRPSSSERRRWRRLSRFPLLSARNLSPACRFALREFRRTSYLSSVLSAPAFALGVAAASSFDWAFAVMPSAFAVTSSDTFEAFIMAA